VVRRGKGYNMKTILLGKVNDVWTYAVKIDGRYIKFEDVDREYEAADAVIYFDSGVYPGITDIDQYMCDRANDWREAMDNQTVLEYINGDACYCPYCGSENLDTEPIEFESRTQQVTCLDCHKEWRDIYEMVGILADGEEFIPFPLQEDKSILRDGDTLYLPYMHDGYWKVIHATDDLIILEDKHGNQRQMCINWKSFTEKETKG